MRVIVNRQMFTARSFDSGALGVLAAVIHQFPEPGRYQAVIRHGDVTARSVWFEVAKSTPNLQLDIDLAPPAPCRTSDNADCACPDVPDKPSGTPRADGEIPSVSPQGYVLFYVSHGEGGYSVRVGREGGEKAAFESTELGKGDLFSLTLLAPTRYSMTNRAGKARGSIAVTMSKDAAKNLPAVEAIYIESSRSSFSPSDVKAVSGQGIVFRILEPSRIVVGQLEEPGGDQGPRGRRRFVVRRPLAARQAMAEKNR